MASTLLGQREPTWVLLGHLGAISSEAVSGEANFVSLQITHRASVVFLSHAIVSDCPRGSLLSTRHPALKLFGTQLRPSAQRQD